MNDSDERLYGEMWKLWSVDKRKKAVKKADINPMIVSIEWENIDFTEHDKLIDAMFDQL